MGGRVAAHSAGTLRAREGAVAGFLAVPRAAGGGSLRRHDLHDRVRRRKFDAELNQEVECDTDDEEHQELDEMPELIKDWSDSG